jgi:hypothetical protein
MVVNQFRAFLPPRSLVAKFHRPPPATSLTNKANLQSTDGIDIQISLARRVPPSFARVCAPAVI